MQGRSTKNAEPKELEMKLSSLTVAQRRTRDLPNPFVLDCSGVCLGAKISQGGGETVHEKGTYFGQPVTVKELFTQIRNRHDVDEFASECFFLSKLISLFVIRFHGIMINETNHLLILQERCECSLKDALIQAREEMKSTNLTMPRVPSVESSYGNC
jgi:hypothetical protein